MTEPLAWRSPLHAHEQAEMDILFTSGHIRAFVCFSKVASLADFLRAARQLRSELQPPSA